MQKTAPGEHIALFMGAYARCALAPNRKMDLCAIGAESLIRDQRDDPFSIADLGSAATFNKNVGTVTAALVHSELSRADRRAVSPARAG